MGFHFRNYDYIFLKRIVNEFITKIQKSRY
jgi:hypothetical protein